MTKKVRLANYITKQGKQIRTTTVMTGPVFRKQSRGAGFDWSVRFIFPNGKPASV